LTALSAFGALVSALALCAHAASRSIGAVAARAKTAALLARNLRRFIIVSF
jgi:hypothetical protein